MTNEEMQKAMEFIVNQQAQAFVMIEALSEAQKQDQQADDVRWKHSDERWERTEEGIRGLLSIAEIHDRDINTVGQQIGSLSQQIRSLSQQISSLTHEISNLGETTRATDERLNVLIKVVERRIATTAMATLERI
ncbi:MAG TPA: hypothetical protein VGO73_06780 [Pyrinomonadaceae bacterium]|nr:hypothetical protein [Pyrinomonadaceae bacterium]